MNKILCLFFVPLFAAATEGPKAPPAPAKAAEKADVGAAKIDKAPLLARFEKTCLQNSAAEGRSQKDLCLCLKNNLGTKLNPVQLSLLVRFYEGDVAAKSEVQKTENSPLLDFDMETAEHCLQDPNWKATKGPITPEETEAVKDDGGKDAPAEAASEKAPAKPTKSSKKPKATKSP